MILSKLPQGGRRSVWRRRSMCTAAARSYTRFHKENSIRIPLGITRRSIADSPSAVVIWFVKNGRHLLCSRSRQMPKRTISVCSAPICRKQMEKVKCVLSVTEIPFLLRPTFLSLVVPCPDGDRGLVLCAELPGQAGCRSVGPLKLLFQRGKYGVLYCSRVEACSDSTPFTISVAR